MLISTCDYSFLFASENIEMRKHVRSYNHSTINTLSHIYNHTARNILGHIKRTTKNTLGHITMD